MLKRHCDNPECESSVNILPKSEFDKTINQIPQEWVGLVRDGKMQMFCTSKCVVRVLTPKENVPA